uniref:Auxilin-like protein n=1 Tax=Heterorhabditis bacteriophora TaxID=37862 RepID=A0A1I7XD96_HETBA
MTSKMGTFKAITFHLRIVGPAFTEKKTIRHSSDLDCNFADPKMCRWMNMEEKWGLDSLDFHLFEKIDFTEFPALRVAPGPTKVAQGTATLTI